MSIKIYTKRDLLRLNFSVKYSSRILFIISYVHKKEKDITMIITIIRIEKILEIGILVKRLNTVKIRYCCVHYRVSYYTAVLGATAYNYFKPCERATSLFWVRLGYRPDESNVRSVPEFRI